MPIYSNTNLKESLKKLLKSKVDSLESKPKLQIVLVGEHLPSIKYTNIKQRIGSELGIEVILHKFDETATTQEILEIVNQLPGTGLIYQLPLPLHLNNLVAQTNWEKFYDVDFLGPNKQLLFDQGLLPPTIQAIDLVWKDVIKPLDSQTLNQNEITQKYFDNKLNLRGVAVTIVGQGKLVGAFLLNYLREREATIISMNEFTEHPESWSSWGEVVIAAAGSKELVDENWVSGGTRLVIDAGTSEAGGKIVGDVDPNLMPDDFYKLTLVPSPGGIGPITVLCLFWNLFKLVQK